MFYAGLDKPHPKQWQVVTPKVAQISGVPLPQQTRFGAGSGAFVALSTG